MSKTLSQLPLWETTLSKFCLPIYRSKSGIRMIFTKSDLFDKIVDSCFSRIKNDTFYLTSLFTADEPFKLLNSLKYQLDLRNRMIYFLKQKFSKLKFMISHLYFKNCNIIKIIITVFVWGSANICPIFRESAKEKVWEMLQQIIIKDNAKIELMLIVFIQYIYKYQVYIAMRQLRDKSNYANTTRYRHQIVISY